MKTLSKEVLQTPTWYFMAPSQLWLYTKIEAFKQESPNTQEKMLEHLQRMENVRPEDINMKVRFE